MVIPNSFRRFQDIVATGAKEPALGNLYSVEFGVPRIFTRMEGYQHNPGEYYEAINYYADNVTIPSRNVTTGEVKNFGIQRTYATGQTQNELTITFLVTKDQWHRNFYEKWMNTMAPDSENRVGFYDDYTTDVFVRKWERGSNLLSKTRKAGIDYYGRLNKAVGVYRFVGVYPYNMGTLEFGNANGDVMKLTITFKYERYRFTTKVEKNKDWTQDHVVSERSSVAEILGIQVLGGSKHEDTQFGT
tara:strand:+ start:153 stop:887 length:735 start_codon:yes stop_codon:yes gene_type:complete